MKVKVCDLLGLVIDSYKEIRILDSNNNKVMVVDSHERYKFGENYDVDVSKVENITLRSNCLVVATDYKEENFEEDELMLYKIDREFDDGYSDKYYMVHGDDFIAAEDCFLRRTQFDDGFEYDLDWIEDQDELNGILKWYGVKSLKDLYEKHGTDLFYI